MPDPEQIVFKHCREGFLAEESGYWTNEYSGRLILQALKTYRLDRDHWREMYWEQNTASIEYADKVMLRIDQLEKDFVAREAAWRKELRKSKLPGFGVFAGPAYCTSGEFQLAVGFGLVWKW